MASINFRIDPFGSKEDETWSMSQLKDLLKDREYPVTVQFFEILQNYLQPDSTISREDAAKSILAIFPRKTGYTHELFEFGELCVEMAEQIPYFHSSQVKFAMLLELLGRSGQVTAYYERDNTYWRFGRFSESVRDNLDEPEVYRYIGGCVNFVNYAAFVANLFQFRIFGYTKPHFAVWAMRHAFEEERNEIDEIRDFYVMGAAQHITWSGQTLFSQILSPPELGESGLQALSARPLYNGEGGLSVHRWQFWKGGFRASSEEEWRSEECKTLCRKTADLMDSIERAMVT